MKAPADVHEWVAFEDPTEERTWLFDVTFLLSGWTCIFGHGCQGVLTGPAPELEQGCCSYGAHFTDDEDMARVEAAAETLTQDQWQFRKQGPSQRGASRTSKDGERVTRLVDGACIFLNRPGFAGRAGLRAAPGRAEAGRAPAGPQAQRLLAAAAAPRGRRRGRRPRHVPVTQWDRRHWGEGGAGVPLVVHGGARGLRRRRCRCTTRWRDELAEMTGAEVYRQLAEYLAKRAAGPITPLPHPVVRAPRHLAVADDRSILDDYAAEQRNLYDVLRGLDDGQWRLPTAAAGWDVRDQVSHLAHTEEVARDTAADGPRSLANETGKYSSGEAFTEAGCDQGRAMSPAAVLDWWWTAAARVRETLGALPSSARVPWGLGMGWRAFVTARLMEHWAHGLDIRSAVGAPEIDTDRLRHVAWICYSALPYAFGVAGVEPPPGHTLRLELTGPGGDTWTYGPSDATDTIVGPAGVWCRRAVQRITPAQAAGLKVDGLLADLAFRHAHAFL